VPNARSCHCHLYPDYNSRPSKLVCTSVTLASFIQPRDVVCSYICFEPPFSLYSQRDKRRFAAPKPRIFREVVLLFIYRLYIFLHDLTCES